MGWNSALCKRLQSVWFYGNSSGNIWSARLWLPKIIMYYSILSVRATKWKPAFVVWGMAICMDVVSLYVLYSCFTPCDATLGNCFFQMLFYAHAHARIMKTQKDTVIPMRTSPGLKWENKTYNLKRSIALNNMHVRVRMSCLNFSISSALTKGRTLCSSFVFS